MRTINLHFDQDGINAVLLFLGTQIGGKQGGLSSHKTLYDAISYLSFWNLNFPVVDIYLRGRDDGEFTAVYRNKPYAEGDPVGYVMGAVFDKHNKKYGFHS